MSYVSTVLSDNPVGFWRLDEATGPNALDLTGKGHTGTYAATGVSYRQAGPMTYDPNDACVFFDGASGCVTIPQGGDFPSVPYSIECWILQSTPTVGPIIEFGSTATWGTHLWEWPNPGDLYLNPCISSMGSVNCAACLTQTASMIWHHIAATYDGATARIYADGLQVGAVAGSGTVVNGGCQNPINFAHRPMSGQVYWWAGRLDDVSLYATALSTARIKAHYQAGVARNYFGRVRSDAPNGYWRLGESATPAVDYANRYATVILGDAPMAYWRLNERSGTALSDISGNNHSGTYTGTTYLAQGGSPIATDSTQASVYFDGSTSYINATDFVITAPFSVELWCYLAGGTQAGGACMISRRTTGNVGGFTLEFTGNANNALNCYIYSDTWHAITTGAISVSTWHHIVFTADAAGNTIAYVDGAQSITGAAFGAMNNPAGPVIWIGQNPGNSALHYAGYMTDVAIYPAVLSAAQVLAHYVAGVGHLGNYASGGITYNQPGALVGDPDGSATLAGTAGSTGLVTIGDAADLRPQGTGWTMEGWVKSSSWATTGDWLRKSTSGGGYFIRNGGSQFQSLFAIGGSYVQPTGGNLPLNIWNHCVAVYDGSSIIRHYINGSMVYSTAASGSFSPNTENVVVGAQGTAGGEYFLGGVDEFAVYPYALSTAQVLDHYRRGMFANVFWTGSGGAFANTGNPIAYWDSTNGRFVAASTQQVVWPGAAGAFATIT